MAPAEPAEDGTLPMVVWLRGDEPLCDDFVLEADEVMERLGIRRSRLTQVSGKELRVGRMRKGRYVVPVYRAIDVDAYVAWTRPTASHLKASTVLKDAAETLRSGHDELADKIASVAPDIVAKVGSEVGVRIEEAAAALAESIGGKVDAGRAEVRAALAALGLELGEKAREDVLLRALERMSEAVRDRGAEVERLGVRVDEQAASQALLAKEVAELAALARLARADGERRDEQLEAALAAGMRGAEELAALRADAIETREALRELVALTRKEGEERAAAAAAAVTELVIEAKLTPQRMPSVVRMRMLKKGRGGRGTWRNATF